MAANPNRPPRPDKDESARPQVVAGDRSFPWPIVTVVIFIIILGLLAYYFFR